MRKPVPAVVWKLRAIEAEEKARVSIERAEKLEAKLQSALSKIEGWMNHCSDLWIALSKLPGGLDAARKLKR